MKAPLLMLLILGFISCSIPGENDDFEVKQSGAMKNFMKDGDVSARADLRDISDTGNLYAIGAVENLKGEILILDGDPHISTVVENELVIDNTFNHKAALLVHTTINSWNSVRIPEAVTTLAELERYVAKTAAQQGIDISKPFPFLVKGTAKSVDWHVIDWEEGDTEHTHEKHRNSGLNGSLSDTEVEILGFYSNNPEAMFTHENTNMHLHVKTKDNSVSGHLDKLTLGDMELALPE